MASNDLVKYQSIEDHTRRGHDNFYQMNLKDKALFKALKNNENNIIAGTWIFHQHLDALNLDEDVPCLALRFVSKADERDASMDGRVCVVVEIEFLDVTSEEKIKGNFKPGTARVKDLVWQTTLHVKDAVIFKECMDWKEQDTKKKWDQYKRC